MLRTKNTGVQIPLLPEIYEPVLSGLKKSGIEFKTSLNANKRKEGIGK